MLGSMENPVWFAFLCITQEISDSIFHSACATCLRICKCRCSVWETWWYLDKKSSDSLLRSTSLWQYRIIMGGLWRKIWDFFVKVSRKSWRYYIHTPQLAKYARPDQRIQPTFSFDPKPFNLTFRVKQQSFCNILNIKVIQFHIRLTHPLEQGLSSTETPTS